MIFFFFNLNLKEERNVDVCGDSLLNVKSMANFLHKEHRTSSYLPMHASSTNQWVVIHSWKKDSWKHNLVSLSCTYIFYQSNTNQLLMPGLIVKPDIEYNVHASFLSAYILLLPQQGQILCFFTWIFILEYN
jgi:hypothetical protein